jgi:beta-galactosidase
MGRVCYWVCFLILLGIPKLASAADAAAVPHSFAVQDGKFVLDGKPIQIISGEMHYTRIPREYWRDRMRMAKAMGLNAITTYVFWNEHEPTPGVYDFSGNNDVAEFVREAQQEGLYVILRPGPYICAEWELGGFPSWLLKDRSMVLRSSDPKFLEPTGRWLKRLGQELAPLQVGNGGPILLVQVENEYGSFGNDHGYMEQIHRMLVDAGFTKAQLYTADGPEQIANGSLPELPVGINFGGSEAGAAQKAFAVLKQTRPQGPFFNSEYWDGWFDHWGDKHATTDPEKEAANLDWMLRQGYSVSLYMFEGGTSFGWMNGANSNGKNYQPDVTSYDYDAPLDESGRPTTKFYLFRRRIAADTGKTPPPVPSVAGTITVPEFKLAEAASLWDTLPQPVHSEQPLTMEDLNQAYGYILYRKELDGPVSGELALHDLHDYAQVYLDGKLTAIIDRRLGQDRIDLDSKAAHSRLDILVENTGRVNFTAVMRDERKGVTREITLAGKPLTGWEIYSLPMLDPAKLTYGKADCEETCFYRGTFNVPHPGDTFLDTSAFTKGEVWLNGRPLGRIWSIGPQKTLYLPGPWLRQGENEIVVFNLQGPTRRTLSGRDKPVLNAVGSGAASAF